MAQIIKHRRGQLSGVKSLTARNAEFIIASGSISDLNGPFVFIGSPNGTDEGVAGAFKSVSKIYQGTSAPTITVGTYGSILDGTPFYASSNESLYILNNDGGGGNSRLDLTGNIEGNLISGVTINNITGSNGNFTNLTGTTFTSTNGDITSLTGSNANITNITGSTISGSYVRVTSDMSVGGKVVVTGDISGSNLNLTGNATIDGDIVLKGNISIGNQTTDLVTFGADVSSSILPDVHNAFDLGSSDKNWRNLHVSGTAYVQTLQVNQVTVTNIDVTGDLKVSGSSFLGNGGDITVISGSVYNDQLTDNRVLIVGPNGRIEDSQYFTFDDVTLKVGTGGGNFEVGTNAGEIRTSGSLLVKSGTTITGSLNVTGSVDLKGNTTVTGSINVTGSANVVGPVDIKGGTTLTGSINVTGSANVVGPVDIKGDTKLTGSLDVSGSANVVGPVDIKGDTKMTGSLNVTNIKGTGSLYLQPNQADSRLFEIYNTAAPSGYTDIHFVGNADFNFFGDDTNFLKIDDSAQTVTIVGVNGVFVSSSLNVTGSLGISGSVNISGGASVTGAFTVGSGSMTSLGGDLYVSGNLQVLGSSTSVNIQSQTVELDDNIIRLNAYSPFQRYAGFEVMDSGSSGVSSSMLWDSQNDYWLLTNQNGSGSKFVGTTFGAQGSEVNLTSGTFPIASGDNTIGDSLLTYSGTTLAFNNNKFTIDSGNGNTMVSGNFTLSYSGGTDNGTKTSAILFRNSSNVVGFVTTTETTDVMDGILGYKQSGGGLVFSTVIDGGTY